MKPSYLITFWCPVPTRDLHFCVDYFSLFLKKYGDIQCLDCGCRRDARTRRLLLQADLVVIGLPQEKQLLDRYFCYGFRRFRNMIYAIVDYFPRESIGAEQICRSYRISPGRLARIPYNARLREAQRRGASRPYLEFRNTPRPYEDFIDFQTELNRSALLMLRALGVV